MERVATVWETYNKSLSSLQAWLEGKTHPGASAATTQVTSVRFIFCYSKLELQKICSIFSFIYFNVDTVGYERADFMSGSAK